MHGTQGRVVSGAQLELDIEKPVAGGRMLARYHGQIVFVLGAIPGERVRAQVTRVARGTVYAGTVDVLVPSADRRSGPVDLRCGGNLLAHVAPARQALIKGQILEDALRRIGRVPVATLPQVTSSPEQGYRMRARCHVAGDRIGFLREGSHELCDAEVTSQLSRETIGWVRSAESLLARLARHSLQSVDISENVPGTERACHLEIASGDAPDRYLALAAGLTGLSVASPEASDSVVVAGVPAVRDRLSLVRGPVTAVLDLVRDPRAFFQGNRYLLQPLVDHVVGLVPEGRVIDLYAGVGLFGLALAALGHEHVALVESDGVAGASLVSNAVPFGTGITVHRMGVEGFLERCRPGHHVDTVVLDPPRTGLSPEALAGLVRLRPAKIIYVSCDPATLARDVRGLSEARYRLVEIRGFDLFPNTAHVESVSVFDRE